MTNWLDPFLKHAETSQEGLADALGVSRATVNRLAQDHSSLKRPRAEKMAKLLGVSVEDLLLNHPPGDTDSQYIVGAMAHNSTVAIPDLDLFGGMGPGGVLDVYADANGTAYDPEQVRGYWTFPEYMLKGIGKGNNVYAWEVRGDSMEPTLPGGSVVFVDTTQNSPPPDDIYAINYGDGLMVKRLKLIPRTDMIAIISDNERYALDEIKREEVTVYGRVIGWFQWRG